MRKLFFFTKKRTHGAHVARINCFRNFLPTSSPVSLKTKRANRMVCSFCWCGKRDLNPYIKDTRPSNVRVCRFRHSRVERYLLYTKEFQKSRGFAKKYFIFFKIAFFDKKLPLSPPDLSKIVSSRTRDLH